MVGIKFVTNRKGQKTAVIINLRKHKQTWEDFYDAMIVEERKHEPRITFQAFKEKMVKAGKL